MYFESEDGKRFRFAAVLLRKQQVPADLKSDCDLRGESLGAADIFGRNRLAIRTVEYAKNAEQLRAGSQQRDRQKLPHPKL